MSFLNPSKKRFWVLLATIGLLVLQFVMPPVRPFIQLAGEVYPGTTEWPIIGPIFGGLTNTFMATLLAFIVVIIIAFATGARSRTADEVPSGFYNFMEMVIEGAYNFAENIAGSKVRDFFPFFMTYIIYIVVANWLGLTPLYDSIGLWEYEPEFALHQEEKVAEVDHPEEFLLEHDEENEGNLRVGPLLLRADKFADSAASEVEIHKDIEVHGHGDDAHGDHFEYTALAGYNSEAADWTIVPFFRPPATDLNFTLALALVAMVMVQYYGVKYLGAREYVAKFFPFLSKTFGDRVAKNKIAVIDPAVGILELISEFSKIISFSFRLLGNLFAGLVLLFVIGFLLPVGNIVFYGLEFFVGLIQAIVFGLLMLIFMNSAAASHHGDEHDEHH